jgi:hypothetical protein
MNPLTGPRNQCAKGDEALTFTWRMVMYRKLALGLIAAASLTAAALAPTGASAHGWGHHGWGHGFGFGGVYLANGYGNGCYVTRRVATPYGLRWRTINVCY